MLSFDALPPLSCEQVSEASRDRPMLPGRRKDAFSSSLRKRTFPFKRRRRRRRSVAEFPPSRSRSQSRRKVVDETFLKLHLDEPTVFSLRPHLGKRSRSALVKKRKWGKPFQPCQVKEKGTAATSNEERKAEEEGETDNYRYTPPIR